MSDLPPGPLFVCELPNALRLEIHDRSQHYFGGYWRLRLEARCPVPLSAVDVDPAVRSDMGRLLGDPVPFLRTLEQMAVPQEQLEQLRQGLLERFVRQLRPLLGDHRFPGAFLVREYRKRLQGGDRGIPCFS